MCLDWIQNQKKFAGTSLAVQWLGLHASTTGGMGLIPSRRTKIPHAVRSKETTKKEICRPVVL